MTDNELEIFIEQKLKEMIVQILEIINEEIKEEANKSLKYPNWQYSKGLNKANNILNNHISELKGDKK